MAPPDEQERERLAQRRAELASKYVKPFGERPQSNARGIHHAALICSDVEQTIKFYDGVLGFPLVELTENRDYPGSSHFFFDLGNSTLLGFFDFPGLGLAAGRGADRHRAAHRDRRAAGQARDVAEEARRARHPL